MKNGLTFYIAGYGPTRLAASRSTSRGLVDFTDEAILNRLGEFNETPFVSGIYKFSSAETEQTVFVRRDEQTGRFTDLFPDDMVLLEAYDKKGLL